MKILMCMKEAFSHLETKVERYVHLKEEISPGFLAVLFPSPTLPVCVN